MAKLNLSGNTLEVKAGLRSRKSIDLDDLRLTYLIIPTGAKWFVVHSSSTTAYIELDSLDDSAFEEIVSDFKGIMDATGVTQRQTPERRPVGVQQDYGPLATGIDDNLAATIDRFLERGFLDSSPSSSPPRDLPPGGPIGSSPSFCGLGG